MSKEALNTVQAIRPRPDITQSLEAIRHALDSMRFGAITLNVHEGRVVQLDVMERTRFPSGAF